MPAQARAVPRCDVRRAVHGGHLARVKVRVGVRLRVRVRVRVRVRAEPSTVGTSAAARYACVSASSE